MNFDCLKFVFRPELRFGAVGDFSASAKEVPGRGTLLVLVLVLVLGGGELGRLAWLGAFDLAARGGVALRSGHFEGVLTVGDDHAHFLSSRQGSSSLTRSTHTIP